MVPTHPREAGGRHGDQGDRPRTRPDRKTVRRFTRVEDVEELLITGIRSGTVDEFKPYLHQRLAEGCWNARQLFTEISEHGYRGSYQSVSLYLRPLRSEQPTSTTARVSRPPPPPTVRQVLGWLTRHPDSHTAEETQRRKEILSRCIHLEATGGHVVTFAQMLVNREGQRLNEWMDAVDADDLPPLKSFTTGLRRDHAAVTAGLTEHYSSGPVEGTVNKIKMLKRQTYGRAGFDLLRKRVLLA